MKVTVCKVVDSLEQQCKKMKGQLYEIKIEVRAKDSEIVAGHKGRDENGGRCKSTGSKK